MSGTSDYDVERTAAAIPIGKSQPKHTPLFAPFSSRMLCTVIDLIIAMSMAGFLEDFLNRTFAGGNTEFRHLMPGILVVYFAGFWASRLGATPSQLLWRFRVVDYDGKSLNPWRAVIRSVIVVFLLLGALSIAGAPANQYIAVASVASYFLLFLAAVTVNRQAAYDLLVHSIVVRRRALTSLSEDNVLRDCVVDNDGGTRKSRRPSIISMIGDALVLIVPLCVIYIAAQAHYDMDMRHRVHYAVGETRAHKLAVEMYYAEFGKLPAVAAELGIDGKTHYPDGGYFFLEQDGRIRIRFTVKPELKTGTIILTPKIKDEGLNWACVTEGKIAQNFLPSECRR